MSGKSTQQIRNTFMEELVKIAPDLDAEDVREEDHLQDDLGLDSMDILNLVAALYKRLGVQIPEADYPHIATTGKATEYLQSRLKDSPGPKS